MTKLTDLVEIFPPDDQVIDEQNQRELWLLPAPPPVGWVDPNGHGR